LLIATGFFDPLGHSRMMTRFPMLGDSAIGISDRHSGYLGGRNPLELIQPIIFVSTTTFSMQSHAMHSNVRMSKPGGPDTTQVNIICPSHFVQRSSSIAARLG
jgi:hypothetical protein